MECLVQRKQRHQRDGRRAVRIGDNALVPPNVAGVHFRDDQRHGVIHAERARIIDHYAAGFDGDGRKFLRNGAAGAEERDVNPFEGILGQFRHGHGLAAKGQCLADGAGRGEQGQFAHRKIPLLQRFEHFDADGARRADDCHMRLCIHKRG